MPANLKTIARQLGLSATTVSRALKDGPEVRPETVARVKEAAAALGYRPDPRAVGLRTGRTGVLALLLWEPIVEDVGGFGHASLIEGFCRRLEPTGVTPMVQLLTPDTDGLERITRMVDARLADGLILSGTRPMDARVAFMQRRNFPFVTFGRTHHEMPHPFYDIDEEQAADQAVSYLAERGCRRIAALEPPVGLSFTGYRQSGYRAALARAGLPFDPGLVRHTSLIAAECRAVTRALMELADPPDGIVCATSTVTLGVAAGLRDCRRAPMRDVAVVSRDGNTLPSYMHPPLPSCFASLSQTGWRLADLLIRAVDGEAPEALQELRPTRLVLPEGVAEPATAVAAA